MKKETFRLIGNAVMGAIMLLDYFIVPIGASASLLPRRVEYAEETVYSVPLHERAEAPKTEPTVSTPTTAQTATPTSNTDKPKEGMRYLGTYKITGYDTCVKCCGKSDGITASGTQATVGRTCAAPKNIPFGTKLYIDGIGERIVEDRGGFADNVIDVLCEDHATCYAITGWYDIYIMEE